MYMYIQYVIHIHVNRATITSSQAARLARHASHVMRRTSHVAYTGASHLYTTYTKQAYIYIYIHTYIHI